MRIRNHRHVTAFARPLAEDAAADWALRWFTPAVESNVCGHATLATAYALPTDREMPLTVRFPSIREIIVTAVAANPGTGYDFVSRHFAPAGG